MCVFIFIIITIIFSLFHCLLICCFYRMVLCIYFSYVYSYPRQISQFIVETIKNYLILTAVQIVSCSSGCFRTASLRNPSPAGKRNVVCYWQAPFFPQQLTDQIKLLDCFIVLFDESLDKFTQTKQLDIHFRYYDEAKKAVNTRFLVMPQLP